MTTTNSPDVVIVGAGIMGSMTALELSRQGASVAVLEKSIPGAEASSAAAGMLGPEFEIDPDDVTFPLALESRRLFPPLSDFLYASTGIEVGHRRCGALELALSAAAVERVAERSSRLKAAGVPSTLHAGTDFPDLEAALGPQVQAALAFHDAAQVEPRALVRAVSLAAEHQGAQFVVGAGAIRLKHDGERLQSIATEDHHFTPKHVLLATGSWTGLIPGLEALRTWVTPVRGQMVTCDARTPFLRHILVSSEGYIVPRADGTMLLGSTEEWVGFAKETTLGGIGKILHHAEKLVPRLAGTRFTGCWANFRPRSLDGRPIIGELPIRNIFVNTGHFRNGILWAPMSARIATDLLQGRSAPAGAEAMSPQRLPWSGDEQNARGASGHGKPGHGPPANR